MKKIYFLMCILALAVTAHAANAIDSIKTAKDVFSFIKKVIPNYKGKQKFDKYYNETKNTADSLQVNNWVKEDIDNNGETDLMVLYADGLDKLVIILAYDGKYEKIDGYLFKKYQFIYPVVKKINNKNIILLFNQDQVDYNKITQHFIYRPLMCDTLLVKDGRILNYIEAPMQYKIAKITVYNDGACEGDCGRISISIDAKTFESECSKERYWGNNSKLYHGKLSRPAIEQIISILQYSNFESLKNYYRIGSTDQTTTTLKITYDGGKIKTIDDYGSSGSFTLNAIYQIAYNVQWLEGTNKQ